MISVMVWVARQRQVEQVRVLRQREREVFEIVVGRFEVPFQDRRQQHRTADAMGHMEDRAERMADAVHRAQPGAGEGHRGHHAALCDEIARLNFTRPCRVQTGKDILCRLHRKRFADRVGLAGDETLDRLRQCVETAGGGDGGRAVVGQLRVHEREVGVQPGAAQRLLDAGFGVEQYRVGSDFRSGSGSGRHFGQKDAVSGNFAAVVEVIRDRAGQGQQRRHALGGVHRRTPAPADDRCRADPPGGGEGAFHIGQRRFRADVGDQFKTPPAQRRDDFGLDPGSRMPPRNEQHRSRRQEFGEFAALIGSEDDCSGKREGVTHASGSLFDR